MTDHPHSPDAPTERDHAIAPVFDFLHNALDDAMDEATQRWGHDLAGKAMQSLTDHLFFNEMDEEKVQLILAIIEEG
jgi:hypothetical protein